MTTTYLQGCNTVWSNWHMLTFQRNKLLPYSWSYCKLTKNWQDAGRKCGRLCLLPASYWFLAWLTLWPWIWNLYMLLRRWWTSVGLHSITPLKAVIVFMQILTLLCYIRSYFTTDLPITVYWQTYHSNYASIIKTLNFYHLVHYYKFFTE
jgi:hypothetical protein